SPLGLTQKCSQLLNHRFLEAMTPVIAALLPAFSWVFAVPVMAQGGEVAVPILKAPYHLPVVTNECVSVFQGLHTSWSQLALPHSQRRRRIRQYPSSRHDDSESRVARRDPSRRCATRPYSLCGL